MRNIIVTASSPAGDDHAHEGRQRFGDDFAERFVVRFRVSISWGERASIFGVPSSPEMVF